MLDPEEAVARVLAAAAALPAETVPVGEALGRFAASDARSAVDLPPFDRSAMDGYAVRAADTRAPLALVGEVAAGEVASAALAAGTTVGITTGAALPPGADAVLQSELAALENGHVVPAQAIDPGRHVRYRGEDVHAGDVLVRAGERITLPRISALASAGVGAVAVHRQARVHLAVTGSELLPVGAPPEPGKIHESNGLMIRLLAAAAGAETVDHGVVPDDPAATRAAIEAGLAGDVLVVSGGVSVGPHDHVKPALAALGVEELFWRVRIKPGKPLWFGRRGQTLVFGVPGNPLSTIVAFQVFIAPALRALHGDPTPGPEHTRARLTVPVQADDGRTTYLTARLAAGADGVLLATPTERQGSHMTGALGESDGFVVAPHDAGELPAGTLVDALVL
jgi:molybdopterin molybdotransferase